MTKSIFVNVSPDPNAPPLLQSMTISSDERKRRHECHRHGVLKRSGSCRRNLGHACYKQSHTWPRVPGIVNVPGGQTSASFTVTTFAVGNNTSVTITAFFDTTTSANLTVTAGAPPPNLATTSRLAHTSGFAYTSAPPPHPAFLRRRSSVRPPTRASRLEQTSPLIGAMSQGRPATRSRSTIKTPFLRQL